MLTIGESDDERRFRLEMQAWAQANIPDELRWNETEAGLLAVDRLLAADGWLAPTWPTEYGGRGISQSLDAVLGDVLGQVGVQRAKSPSHSGVNNLGPALIVHASAAQKAFFLPRILSVEHRWCQGFSETEAGSDLASVRTTARLEGDQYIVNGSKMWTSGAEHANWIYALVRTGSRADRHKALAFLVFEMSTPGITHRSIQQINGASDFSEVFFDDVAVPRENIIGADGEGWAVAMTLLASERLSGRHRYASFVRECEAIATMIAKLPVERRAEFYRELGQMVAEVEGMAALGRRVQSVIQADGDVAALPSVNKLWWPAAHQRLLEFGLKVATTTRDDPSVWYERWLTARPESIYGGSRQIHRNIIAERFLKLPRTPRPGSVSVVPAVFVVRVVFVYSSGRR